MASTNQKKIRAEVKRQVREGDMEFGRDKKELDKLELIEIDKSLEYGYIDIVGNGEKL